jgi:hypothetical protein
MTFLTSRKEDVAAPRIEFEGAPYQLMMRGYRCEGIFLDDKERLKFLEYLEEGAGRRGVLVHCYVQMGKYFHLPGDDGRRIRNTGSGLQEAHCAKG